MWPENKTRKVQNTSEDISKKKFKKWNGMQKKWERQWFGVKEIKRSMIENRLNGSEWGEQEGINYWWNKCLTDWLNLGFCCFQPTKDVRSTQSNISQCEDGDSLWVPFCSLMYLDDMRTLFYCSLKWIWFCFNFSPSISGGNRNVNFSVLGRLSR